MITELRKSDTARRHVLESLWLARSVRLSPAVVKSALEWAHRIAASGSPLPLAGFIADVGHVALGPPQGEVIGEAPSAPPHVDSALVRKYEDYVLGKLYADLSFQRAADALHRYDGTDRARGLAFLVEQFRQRAGIGGVIVSPAVVKSLAQQRPDEVLAESWKLIDEHGFSPAVLAEFEQLTQAVRGTGDALAREDIFELEHGTALAGFGQRLALRQVLQAAEWLEESLPQQKLRITQRKQQVATRIFDEDLYPVGGYTSLSTRGTIESLLQSQLALMERDERPDLFDIKFVRDELLYYARDENQFFRRRQTLVFALSPDLVGLRVKDGALRWQRIVLVLAVLLTAVRKLLAWLSDESLVFRFVLLEGGARLDDEAELLAMLLREEIASGTVVIDSAVSLEQLVEECNQYSRRSQCRCLVVSYGEVPSLAACVGEVRTWRPGVDLPLGDDPETTPPSGEGWWHAATEQLLQWWMA